jgi:hypothetical protein
LNATEKIITELEARWPRWQCWVVIKVVGGTTWCARPWEDPVPARVLNAGSPAELEEYLTEADAGLPGPSRDQPMPGGL